jgi:uncharacterized membrane protein
MMPMMYWFGGLGMLIPALTLLVLIVGTIVTVMLLLDRWPTRDLSTRNDGSAELLRMRYAAGEIDAEEYRKRLTDLRTTTVAGR